MPVLAHSYAHFQPVTDLGPAYPAAVSADGTHWVDQYGQPVLFADAEVWMLYCNAGKWGVSSWQDCIDTFYATIASQGFNAHEVSCFSDHGVPTQTYDDGRDWDGAYPFTSTFNPSSGLNATFWARRDYALESARAQGVAVVMNMTTMSVSNSMCAAWTNQQWTDFGTAVGGWAAGKYPNLYYIMGDDYTGDYDAQFTLFLTALRAAGDDHLISVQNWAESTSRTNLATGGVGNPISWGTGHAQYTWGYSYACSYLCIEVSKSVTPALPAMWNDGDGLTDAGQGAESYWERMYLWWALSSGAAGVGVYDESITYWPSAAVTQMGLTYFYPNQMPAIVSFFSGLDDWQGLVPDTGSALVTSGRGTKAAAIPTGEYYNPSAGINDYVTASRTADGTLALIYCAVAFTITIDESKMAAGYTATWVDPATGATSAGTPGSSYSSSGRGNNSTGRPDWLLVLQG